jgi:type III secretion protein Y
MKTDQNAKELLHSLSYVYGCQGQTRRALVLNLIAARLAPDDQEVLRTLAYTFLLDGAPDQALEIIERLYAMQEAGEPTLQLLKSQALWAAGRHVEARETFKLYHQQRAMRDAKE